MSLNLSKGGSLNLSKASATTKFYIGLGWPEKTVQGHTVDLDVTAIVCDASGNALSANHVLFYNQKNKAEGFADDSLVHGGDSRDGAGTGDDEFITIDTSKIDPRASEIAIIVTMHDAPSSTTFKDLGTTEPTFIHILENDKFGSEILKYVVTDVASDATCLQFGSLMKEADGSWRFEAVGQGGKADLLGVLRQYSVPGM